MEYIQEMKKRLKSEKQDTNQEDNPSKDQETLGYEQFLLLQDSQLNQQYSPIHTQLSPYQYFIKFQIHPLSDKYRFLIKFGTGLGKTLSSLLAAKNFIDKGINVTIVTFNKQVFYEDLMKFPQLGFVTEFEKNLLSLYIKNIGKKTNLSQEEEEIQKIYKQVMQRINSKITFYGYKELQNTLFWYDTSDELVKINTNLINNLFGSLIIFDEIHNVYNKEDNNTWGKAIQFLSEFFDDKIYFIYISATPLNNPEEICELVQLMKVDHIFKHIDNEKAKQIILKTADQIKIKASIQDTSINKSNIQKSLNISQSINHKQKSNFADVKLQNAVEQVYQQLPTFELQDATNNIHKYMKNRVAFVPDAIQNVPKYSYIGSQYQSIQYIKLVKCDINEYWQQYYESVPNYLYDEEWRKHICLNFPQISKDKTQQHEQIKLEKFVQFYFQQNKQILTWCNQNGIQLSQNKAGEYFFEGDFLKLKNIQKYSPKFYYLVSQLLEVQGKSFIYTNYVKGFGINFIASLLKANGLIEDGQLPNQNTLCYVCRKQFKDHQNSIQHSFVPYKFIMITGKNNIINVQQLQIFNSQFNINGEKIQVILGSKKIKEGYNLLGINNTYILSIPFNIPNLIQVLGRPIRNNSHTNLPEIKRYVNIHILVTSNKTSDTIKKDSYDDLVNKEHKSQYFKLITREELEYYEKMQKYLEIQQYERKIHECAGDIKLYSNLYFITNFLEEDKQNIKYSVKVDNDLKMIPFEIQKPKKIDKSINNFDFMKNYYLLEIEQDIVQLLRQIIQQKIKQKQVWQQHELIQEIKKAQTSLNLNNIEEGDILLQINNQKHIYMVGDLICYFPEGLQYNTFLNQYLRRDIKKMFITIESQNIDMVNKQINISELFVYLYQQFPQYILNIFAGSKLQTTEIQPSSDQISNILQMLQKRLGKYQIQLIEDQTKQLFKDFYQKREKINIFFCSEHLSKIDQQCSHCKQYLSQQNNIDDKLQKLIVFQLLIMFVSDNDIFQQGLSKEQSISQKSQKFSGIVGSDIHQIQYFDGQYWQNIDIVQNNLVSGGYILVNNKQIRLVQTQKQLQDKRHKIHGPICANSQFDQIQKFCEIMNIQYKKEKKNKICELIQDELTYKELYARLNFKYQKYVIFDYLNTIQV